MDTSGGVSRGGARGVRHAAPAARSPTFVLRRSPRPSCARGERLRVDVRTSRRGRRRRRGRAVERSQRLRREKCGRLHAPGARSRARRVVGGARGDDVSAARLGTHGKPRGEESVVKELGVVWEYFVDWKSEPQAGTLARKFASAGMRSVITDEQREAKAEQPESLDTKRSGGRSLPRRARRVGVAGRARTGGPRARVDG